MKKINTILSIVIVALVVALVLVCVIGKTKNVDDGTMEITAKLQNEATAYSTVSDILSDPVTLEEQYYYVMGYYIASNYGYYYPDLDWDMYARGAYDYGKGLDLYTMDQMDAIINEYEGILEAEYVKMAEENLAEAETFLSKNGKKDGVVTTASGLQYKVSKQGDGAYATLNDSVIVDYRLTLLDGSVMDEGTSVTFPLSGLIDGFAEACTIVPVGSSATVWIHPSLGYGEGGSGAIEPNTLLVFELTVNSIVAAE